MVCPDSFPDVRNRFLLFTVFRVLDPLSSAICSANFVIIFSPLVAVNNSFSDQETSFADQRHWQWQCWIWRPITATVRETTSDCKTVNDYLFRRKIVVINSFTVECSFSEKEFLKERQLIVLANVSQPLKRSEICSRNSLSRNLKFLKQFSVNVFSVLHAHLVDLILLSKILSSYLFFIYSVSALINFNYLRVLFNLHHLVFCELVWHHRKLF